MPWPSPLEEMGSRRGCFTLKSVTGFLARTIPNGDLDSAPCPSTPKKTFQLLRPPLGDAVGTGEGSCFSSTAVRSEFFMLGRLCLHTARVFHFIQKYTARWSASHLRVLSIQNSAFWIANHTNNSLSKLGKWGSFRHFQMPEGSPPFSGHPPTCLPSIRGHVQGDGGTSILLCEEMGGPSDTPPDTISPTSCSSRLGTEGGHH